MQEYLNLEPSHSPPPELEVEDEVFEEPFPDDPSHEDSQYSSLSSSARTELSLRRHHHASENNQESVERIAVVMPPQISHPNSSGKAKKIRPLFNYCKNSELF